jgi:hypothetical protein
MITNTGKTIIGKYLLGQAPAFASYIAVGCGPQPFKTSEELIVDSNKENLDFEMFRVPISSRGYVQENGMNKIVLTAELPTEERYEITEVGIYSAGSNPSAGSYDSKTVFAFTDAENWEYHTSAATSPIPTIPVPLDTNDDNNITGSYLINSSTKEYDAVNGVLTATPVFQANSDNSIFYKTSRALRYERCRFLNNTILIQGNTSDLDINAVAGPTYGHFDITSGSHIHLTGVDLDFDKNSLKDELRLAFSLVSKTGSASGPDTVRILVDFASDDETTSPQFARFEANLNNGSSLSEPLDDEFETNRYYVVSKPLQDLYTSPNFSWNAVNVVKIYVSVIDNGNPSSDYYVALDALRLENVATKNPLYGLTGYTVVQNTGGETIIKSPNTNNYVEFRFSIGVS